MTGTRVDTFSRVLTVEILNTHLEWDLSSSLDTPRGQLAPVLVGRQLCRSGSGRRELYLE